MSVADHEGRVISRGDGGDAAMPPRSATDAMKRLNTWDQDVINQVRRKVTVQPQPQLFRTDPTARTPWTSSARHHPACPQLLVNYPNCEKRVRSCIPEPAQPWQRSAAVWW